MPHEATEKNVRISRTILFSGDERATHSMTLPPAAASDAPTACNCKAMA